MVCMQCVSSILLFYIVDLESVNKNIYIYNRSDIQIHIAPSSCFYLFVSMKPFVVVITYV